MFFSWIRCFKWVKNDFHYNVLSNKLKLKANYSSMLLFMKKNAVLYLKIFTDLFKEKITLIAINFVT